MEDVGEHLSTADYRKVHEDDHTRDFNACDTLCFVASRLNVITYFSCVGSYTYEFCSPLIFLHGYAIKRAHVSLVETVYEHLGLKHANGKRFIQFWPGNSICACH